MSRQTSPATVSQTRFLPSPVQLLPEKEGDREPVVVALEA